MPAITDYASLLSEVEDQLERDDLANRLPRFIQMTEAVLRRNLRTLDMEISVEEVVPAETASFDLPDDLLSLRAIYIKGDAAEDEPNLPLEAYSPAAFASRFTGLAGVPTGFARIGNTIQLAPTPEEETTLVMLYLARFDPLTESVTNWILDNHPDVYFYGVCAQAMQWDRDDNNPYAALFAGAIEDLKSSRANDRWGPGMAVPSPVRQVRGARC